MMREATMAPGVGIAAMEQGAQPHECVACRQVVSAHVLLKVFPTEPHLPTRVTRLCTACVQALQDATRTEKIEPAHPSLAACPTTGCVWHAGHLGSCKAGP